MSLHKKGYSKYVHEIRIFLNPESEGRRSLVGQLRPDFIDSATKLDRLISGSGNWVDIKIITFGSIAQSKMLITSYNKECYRDKRLN